MDTSTLATKFLLPRRRDDVLTRQRLTDRLYDMVDYRLVLVSAPAGYGKTTLLSDFASDLEHPVCWYALDASDRDPRLFLTRLVTSIRRRFPGFGDATLRAVAASANLGNGAPSVVRVLVNEIVARVPRWFVIVLDDYHVLDRAPAVDAIISNFLAYQRDQCLTVIASRDVPDFPLIIPLVARGGVGGIGQEELRFSADEVQALWAHNYDTEITLEQAGVLAAESEGWITGLLLTADGPLQNALQTWMRARRSQKPVYDYLALEVLDGQSKGVQRFLMSTSTLSEMNARLIEGALGIKGAAASLETIERGNLFVTRLEDDWFRYHPLFRDFLQSKLRSEEPDCWRELHHRAASWHEANDQPLASVRHLLAVGAFREAARLMTGIARDLYVGGRLTTLMAWYEELPTEILGAYPRLALYLSRAAYKVGDRVLASSLAEEAEHAYRAAANDEGLAYALLQRSEVWLTQGELQEALSLARRALALVEETSVPVAYEAHRMVGRIYVRLGNLPRARQHLESALATSQEQGGDYAAALARTALAQCLGRQGQLAEAAKLNRDAVLIWRQLGSDAALADELNDLGFHLNMLGDYDEAMSCFREALAISRDTGLREAEAVALANLGELAGALGLTGEATQYLDEGRALATEIGDRYIAAYCAEAMGLALWAEGRLSEARRLIESAIAGAEEQESNYQLGRYGASLGLVVAEMGDAEAGLRALETAETTLQGLGLATDLDRARMFRAWVLYLFDARAEALALLGELLDGVPEGSEVQVFVATGRRFEPLYSLAREVFRASETRYSRLRSISGKVASLTAAGERLFAESPRSPHTEESQLRLYGFGRARAELNGQSIEASAWGSAAARHLLFYMMSRGSRSRDQIFADFWPELSARKAKAAFHTTKFRLHRAVGRDVIGFDGRVYAPAPDLDAVYDVERFRAALTAWRATQDIDALERAIDLYEGDFLTDCYMDWCVEEREALYVRYLGALEALAERLLARRQYRRAASVLREAVSFEPAREVFHRQLMRAYALSGQRSRALAQYERCRQDLQRELDAAPSQATEVLRSRILEEAPID